MRSLIAFLLISSFGILFAGCGGPDEVEPENEPDEFRFTAEDVERFRELARRGTGSIGVPRLELHEENDGPLVLDLSLVDTYAAIRTSPEEDANAKDLFRVTNEFLNVRDQPNVTSRQVDRLNRGDLMVLLEFIDARWAKVKLMNEVEGFVSSRYIAKLTSEEKLAEERSKYEGLYFVNFGFLNVRKDADTASEKIGELQGQAFVRPLSMDSVWARIPFEDGEGYVAVDYLEQYIPNFLVRQDEYRLPVLHYRLIQDGMIETLSRHIDRLKEEGKKIVTMKDFYNMLLKQEEKDIRLDPNQVVVAISDITADNVQELSDALSSSNARATLFVQTKNVGIGGVTEKAILTLMANGNDIQSGAHSGDDLRSLTNAQVELELGQSRQILEQITKRPVFAVAYPQGGTNDRVAGKAAAAGYLIGLSASEDTTFRREQLLKLPSISVKNSTMSDEIMVLIK